MTPGDVTLDEAIGHTLERAVATLDLAGPEPPEAPERIVDQRRRRGAPRGSALASVSLIRVDGSLQWVFERSPRATGPRRMRRAGSRTVGGEVVRRFGFEEIPPNSVIAAIEKLDDKLTPKRGLRRWRGGVLEDAAAVRGKGHALLFVHGTFSKSDMFFEQFGETPEGRKFLDRAAAYYDQILAFDHPTLSVSPILNALDLEEAFGVFAGKLDIVCHSRGGLVTSWWLRLGPRRVEQLVYVASPLEGTSLAAPARLKQALDGFANIAGAIGAGAKIGAALAPPAAALLGTAAGLMRILGGILSLGARTPLSDTGVAVVPGLAGQSRVEKNRELERLHRAPWPADPKCISAITSDFEPDDPSAPAWQFWKRWRMPAVKLAAEVADVIFQDENDLVVDTASMTRLHGAAIPKAQVYSFGTNGVVHHCNYFAQPKTAERLTKWLQLP